MSDGFEGYDAWKLQSPEDAGYRFGRGRSRRERASVPLSCLGCGERCEGLYCDACAEEREEER